MARLAVAFCLLLSLAGCNDDNERDEVRRPATLSEWAAVLHAEDERFDEVISGDKRPISEQDQCRDARRELGDRRAILLDPPDDRLRELMPPYLEAWEELYDACAEGDLRSAGDAAGRTATRSTPVYERLRELGELR